jgi:hypothetical protein
LICNQFLLFAGILTCSFDKNSDSHFDSFHSLPDKAWWLFAVVSDMFLL